MHRPSAVRGHRLALRDGHAHAQIGQAGPDARAGAGLARVRKQQLIAAHAVPLDLRRAIVLHGESDAAGRGTLFENLDGALQGDEEIPVGQILLRRRGGEVGLVQALIALGVVVQLEDDLACCSVHQPELAEALSQAPIAIPRRRDLAPQDGREHDHGAVVALLADLEHGTVVGAKDELLVGRPIAVVALVVLDRVAAFDGEVGEYRSAWRFLGVVDWAPAAGCGV
ncbi:hypothetical protein D9M68_704020 [compost metagenome]